MESQGEIMRIALFTDTYLPDINGVVSSVELLRKKLEDKGHEAYVVCTYSGFLKIRKEGRIIYLPGIELKGLYGYKATSPAHFLFLEELESYHFDLIHVHTEFGVGIFAGIAAKHLQIPLVRTYHTTYEGYTHYINFMNSATLDMMAKKVVSFLSKQYGNGCIRLVSPSQKTADMLRGYGIKTPIEIIPTGIELARFATEKNQQKIREIRQECQLGAKDKLFLFVGRVAAEKSIDMLLDGVQQLCKKRHDFKLLIVGSGPQEQDLLKIAQKKEITDFVIFAGKKPFAEIPHYYHAADAFLSASTTETQGMTYIEAFASGLPVFAHVDEVLEDLIQENKNGYYFSNAEELAAKLNAFYALSSEEYSEMKKTARATASIYDADTFVMKMLHLYREAIEEYAFSYEVERLTVKNDYVTLSLRSSSGEKETILLSVDDLYEEGIRRDDKISSQQLARLRKRQEISKAYRNCLKKIAGRDYTIKQMYDYLTNKTELPIQQINAIIEKLMKRGLLDDRKYVISKLNSFEATLYSQKKILNKLRNEGVAVELIEEYLSRDEDKERVKARKVAQKYQQSIRNKSVAAKKEMILQKLLRDGFSFDVAKNTLEELDFTEEEFHEKDILREEANKICKRLKRKYQGTLLRNRLYHALASKGFRSEAIFAILNEMEWKDE